MLELKASTLFFIGLLNFLIGLFVLYRDPRDLKNRLFFVFSLSLGGWVFGIGGFLLADSPYSAHLWAKVYYAFPLLIAATMPLFTRTFPDYEPIPAWLRRFSVYGFMILAIPLIIIPNFITGDLIYHDWGKEIVLNKAEYFLYSGYLLISFSIGLSHIYFKANKLSQELRKQARAFFWGFTLTSSLGVLFNLIYPWFGNYRLIWLGPLFTNAFIISTGYSIIKYKMFDIRFVVIRATFYTLTTLTLSLLYVAPVIFLVGHVISGYPFHLTAFIFATVVATFCASFFDVFKKWFNKSTTNLFFRDAYEPEQFIADLNSIMVSTYKIDEMLDKYSHAMCDNLKAEYCVFGINSYSNFAQTHYGTTGVQFSAADITRIRTLVSNVHQKVIITDFLQADFTNLKNILIKNDIAVLARITANIDYENEGLGYILLGAKKSGNAYNGRDIRTISVIVDGLVIAIQNALHFEEIQKFNLTLQQKVDTATIQLRRTNAKLEALDETKDDFISMASHQLRTPLTSVKGYLSMVIDGDAGGVTPMQKKMLNQAFMSSQRMVFLIADLLNVSRLKTGKFVIEPVALDLSEMITQEIGQLRETAKLKSIELKYVKPKKYPQLMLDETKTRQVVMNFIDNAIHYTPAGGHITIELIDKPQSAELRVRDDGIGVPKNEQHHLFTKFYRAVNARRERPDGTGLGLFMAKKVVLAQGGAVLFESKEGVGSMFGFTLPKEKLLVK